MASCSIFGSVTKLVGDWSVLIAMEVNHVQLAYSSSGNSVSTGMSCTRRASEMVIVVISYDKRIVTQQAPPSDSPT